MRRSLVPGGTADVVLLYLGESYNFHQMTTAEVKALIDQFEITVLNSTYLEHGPNPLEKLGIQVLLDSLKRR